MSGHRRPIWIPEIGWVHGVFRLLRPLRLMRAGILARRLLSTEGVRDAAVLALLTVLGGGAAYAAVEKSQDLDTFDGIWWALRRS